MARPAGSSARSSPRASRRYAARRWRCSNRREASPAPQAVRDDCTRQHAFPRMGSVRTVEDKETKSAQTPRTALATRPRLSLPCPRMSRPTTVEWCANSASDQSMGVTQTPWASLTMRCTSTVRLPQRNSLGVSARYLHRQPTSRALAARGGSRATEKHGMTLSSDPSSQQSHLHHYIYHYVMMRCIHSASGSVLFRKK